MFYVVESKPIDDNTGLRCDQIIRLRTRKGKIDYPKSLRRISYVDTETGKRFSFPDQPFRPACFDYCGDLQESLANRTLFQVDQAKSADQGLLRDHGERRAHPNLDRHLRLPHGGLSQ
jgi:hypothetical protein